MKKPFLLFSLVFCFYSLISSQELIKFDEKSILITNEVANSVSKFYNETNYGDELIINVLTKKEKKKLTDREKMNFSRVRVKKLAAYFKDTLGVKAHNILTQLRYMKLMWLKTEFCRNVIEGGNGIKFNSLEDIEFLRPRPLCLEHNSDRQMTEQASI